MLSPETEEYGTAVARLLRQDPMTLRSECTVELYNLSARRLKAARDVWFTLCKTEIDVGTDGWDPVKL